MNHSIAGTWVTFDKHIITFDEGIRNATFIANDKSIKVESFILQSSDAADKLIYHDTTRDYRWYDVYERGLTVELRFEYNPDQDIIEGEIEILNIEHPDGAGKDYFYAKRKGASD
mmetsp:Transcript_14386/g.36156  ORF Transcript_14386/g.36156 Transcript_14386/m.36156 type:complete len:115 (-) Transcript_14386:1006-1350(-)